VFSWPHIAISRLLLLILLILLVLLILLFVIFRPDLGPLTLARAMASYILLFPLSSGSSSSGWSDETYDTHGAITHVRDRVSQLVD
jgi:hypothetical protein